jgi:hypothetical protein
MKKSTSARKAAANKRNAAKSTGPKSAAGRTTSAGNSRKHGLSSAQRDQADLDFAEDLARQIILDSDGAIELNSARTFAYAHLEVLRVKRAKAEAWLRLMQNEPTLFGRVGSDLDNVQSQKQYFTDEYWAIGQPVTRDFNTLRLLLVASKAGRRDAAPLIELGRMERYERRAISRRKNAARALEFRNQFSVYEMIERETSEK